MYPLAAAYATPGPGNRYYKSPELLAVIIKAGQALIDECRRRGPWVFRKKDGSTWGMTRMPWTYSRWIRSYRPDSRRHAAGGPRRLEQGPAPGLHGRQPRRAGVAPQHPHASCHGVVCGRKGPGPARVVPPGGRVPDEGRGRPVRRRVLERRGRPGGRVQFRVHRGPGRCTTPCRTTAACCRPWRKRPTTTATSPIPTAGASRPSTSAIRTNVGRGLGQRGLHAFAGRPGLARSGNGPARQPGSLTPTCWPRCCSTARKGPRPIRRPPPSVALHAPRGRHPPGGRRSATARGSLCLSAYTTPAEPSPLAPGSPEPRKHLPRRGGLDPRRRQHQAPARLEQFHRGRRAPVGPHAGRHQPQFPAAGRASSSTSPRRPRWSSEPGAGPRPDLRPGAVPHPAAARSTGGASHIASRPRPRRACPWPPI